MSRSARIAVSVDMSTASRRVEVRWVGFFWLGSQQFFRFWPMYGGWMWACGPINLLYSSRTDER